MTVQTPVSADPQALQLQNIWVDCIRGVLGQIAGFPVTVAPATEQESAAAQAVPEKQPVWELFSASKALRGDMAILSSETEALLLAQMLVSETPDPSIAFDKDRRDAYQELLRQILGQVATSLKSVAGGDVELKPSGSDAPTWPGASCLGLRITSEKFQPIHLDLIATVELLQSLRPVQPEKEPAPKKAAEPASKPPTETTPKPPDIQVSEQPDPSAARTSNLELLLDVKLDATIRFGRKQMLLREIMELHPGSAVALDRQVEEPVELLVGGRMVAWGEVVIVDGNYGLRITEILTPQQRIETLRT
jgi:flagellar motor switch protein FliN